MISTQRDEHGSKYDNLGLDEYQSPEEFVTSRANSSVRPDAFIRTSRERDMNFCQAQILARDKRTSNRGSHPDEKLMPDEPGNLFCLHRL